ncbi:MAG: hypothetical protein IPK24_08330 [Kineosporiaceae bacterium]|nr:hypothetical protein [Kineosporiaceae bacterium]
MSREVLGPGDARADGDWDETWDASVPLPPPDVPTRALPVRRRRALAGLTFAAGILVGWAAFGTASWTPAVADPPGLSLAATLVDLHAAGPDPTGGPQGADPPLSVIADLAVANLTGQAITLDGPGAPLTAARVRGLTPSSPRIAAQAHRQVTAAIEISCGSPQALDLPPLQITRADGRRGSVPVDGAASQLTAWCARQRPEQALLVRQVVADGERLRLDLTVPGGRTALVAQIEVGGVVLTGRPLPAMVDGQVRSIWLDPPGRCQDTWLAAGIPTAFDLTVEAPAAPERGARSWSRLPGGASLAQWLLDSSCSG